MSINSGEGTYMPTDITNGEAANIFDQARFEIEELQREVERLRPDADAYRVLAKLIDALHPSISRPMRSSISRVLARRVEELRGIEAAKRARDDLATKAGTAAGRLVVEEADRPLAVVTDNRQRAVDWLDKQDGGVADYSKLQGVGLLRDGTVFYMVDSLERIEGREFSQVWVCGFPSTRLIHAAKMRVR
jgi:PHD/YefM family antitoxin component YafN of YafNO toxin-antitoxin module